VERTTSYTHIYPSCGSLPLRNELSWRFVNFIRSCLTIDSVSVRFVARRGVFCRRMLSPVDRNAQYCCSRYNASLADLTRLQNINIWHRPTARAVVSDDTWKIMCFILQLLFIKCVFYVLDLFSHAELDSLASFLCTN